MRLKVLFHDNCFDGAASAAVFTRFYREKIRPDAEVEFQGLHHKPGAGAIDDAVFTGDENVIVDFRYSQHPGLTWWFDHHISAFQQPGDEEHFRKDNSGRKFHDPKRKSNTNFLADTLKEKFGFDPQPMSDLLYWAEIIDGALFESPKMAVELREPALQIMTVLEAAKEAQTILNVIEDMQSLSLAEIAQKPYISEPFRELYARHQENIELVRKKAKYENGVVSFDVADEGRDSMNKFISYYLYPDAAYTVWVGRGPKRSKISIGSNPWKPQLRRHDLSKMAEKFGGGGHPVVAAASFASEDIDKARAAAAELLAELRKS